MEEAHKVRELWLEANQACVNLGAVLDKPYGPCADMVYRRYDSGYITLLKNLKRELDPNNIMNPGQLCF